MPSRLIAALLSSCALVLSSACGPSKAADKPIDPAAVERAMGRSTQPPPNISQLFDRLAPLTAPPPGTAGSRAADLVSRAARPVADSQLLQRVEDVQTVNPADGALGRWENGADRRQFEDIPELRGLTTVAQEIPNVRIGWYINASIDAFRRAIEQNKPLVLVLGDSYCSRYCLQLIQQALRCPAVNRFAGSAVFAYSMPSRDKGAVAIEGSLGIEAVPTLTVLEPEARMLLERGRVNGFFGATKLGEHLETILWRTPPRGYEQERPFLSQPTIPAPTTADAIAGARQRQLQEASPLPQCQ
jgi:hypothetical protein